VAYLFSKVGLLSYPAGSDEDAIMEAALEAGADDVATNDDGSIDVLTEPNEFVTVKEAMAVAGHTPEQAEVTMRASTDAPLGLDEAQKMVRLLEVLEDQDDVQNVYSNADIPEEVLAQL
jgi:transcriptional/translational regulatory protein YebC/TACO1